MPDPKFSKMKSVIGDAFWGAVFTVLGGTEHKRALLGTVRLALEKGDVSAVRALRLAKAAAVHKDSALRSDAQDIIREVLKNSQDLLDKDFFAGVARTAFTDEADYVRCLAYRNLSKIIELRPAFVDEGLVMGIAKETTNGQAFLAKDAALAALCAVAKKRPEFIKPEHTASVLNIAAMERSSYTRGDAMKTLGAIIAAQPDFVDEDMVADITKIAIRDMMDENTCVAALEMLGALIKNRRDLAKDAFAVVSEASADSDWGTRYSAQLALTAILEKKPDLADEALPVIKAAAGDDNTHVRSTAMDIIAMIVTNRPDLTADLRGVVQTAFEKAIAEDKPQLGATAKWVLGVMDNDPSVPKRSDRPLIARFGNGALIYSRK
jgi:hypothetical protein